VIPPSPYAETLFEPQTNLVWSLPSGRAVGEHLVVWIDAPASVAERRHSPLGRTLGDVIADQCGTPTLDLVEAIRRAAVFDPDPARLIDLLDPLPIADALHVIRAFSYFAMLANIAEDTDHAAAAGRSSDSGTAAPPATLERAIRLIRESGVGDDDTRGAVAASEVVPVLTAHPTEIRREPSSPSSRRSRS
jgi:phosphoenolpyruvate carboxylase